MDKRKIMSENTSYFQENYIPEDISYEFKDFIQFFEKRKRLMKEELTRILLND